MRKVLILTVFMMALTATACKKQEMKGEPFGVNMAGGDFGSNFPGEYNKDYTYPTAVDLDYWHEKGLMLIRFPFKWERLQIELDENLNSHDLTQMKTFVKAAEDREMPVILDLHNYCRRYMNGEHVIIGTKELTPAHLAGFWKKIAIEFKDFTNIYAYGLMNEPHDMGPGTTWFQIAQQCIDSIRTVDSKSCIMIGGNRWSSSERWVEESDTLRYLIDPANNLCFEAHCYFDLDSSGTYKFGYEGDEGYSEKGIDLVKPFVTWLKKYNLRGFVGEYGIPDDDERWNETLDLFMSYLQRNGINGTYWAAGPWWPADNFMAVSPVEGTDRPQMKVLGKYMSTK